MNLKTQTKINDALRYLSMSNKSGSHLNCIRLNPSCSDCHNDEIIKRCKEYLKSGIPFMTEAIFIDSNGKRGGRCDILLPATHDIIEVMKTETEEDFLKKHYPQLFKITKIRVNS